MCESLCTLCKKKHLSDIIDNSDKPFVLSYQLCK